MSKERAGMSNAAVVQHLIRGSENLDRVKAEIVQVIRMMTGLMELCEGVQDLFQEQPRIFPSKGCRWEVSKMTRHTEGRPAHYDVIYYRFRCRANDSKQLLFYLEPTSEQFYGIERVSEVYRALPDLVAGLIDLVPNLWQKCQPFIMASDYPAQHGVAR